MSAYCMVETLLTPNIGFTLAQTFTHHVSFGFTLLCRKPFVMYLWWRIGEGGVTSGSNSQPRNIAEIYVSRCMFEYYIPCYFLVFFLFDLPKAVVELKDSRVLDRGVRINVKFTYDAYQLKWQ